MVLLLTAGCGAVEESDPENDRLQTGQEARLYSAKSDNVAVMREGAAKMMAVGTKVEVVDDSAEDPKDSHRFTVVNIKEGDLAGKAGRVYRDNLRAVTALPANQ
jgi:hypothetical protein